MLDLAVLVWCTRTFYILSSAIILAVRLIPDLKTRFLSYGARDSGGTTTAAAVAAVHNHNHNHNHNATGSRLLQQKQRQEQQSSSPPLISTSRPCHELESPSFVVYPFLHLIGPTVHNMHLDHLTINKPPLQLQLQHQLQLHGHDHGHAYYISTLLPPDAPTGTSSTFRMSLRHQQYQYQDRY